MADREDQDKRKDAIHEIHVTMNLDPYLDLRALVTYSGLSKRTLQGWLHHHDLPLPHYDVGGKVLVRQSEFDRWMQHLRDPRSYPPSRAVKRVGL